MIQINSLYELFSNRILLNSILAWFIAQTLKVILHSIADKKFDINLIHESGGMPSSHSAIVCALSVGIGLEFGFNSAFFAIAGVFAMVVMYDAMGVRRSAGEQSKVLNKLIDMMNISDEMQTTLKEVTGHTPIEVLAGAVIGILVGILA